MKEDYTRFIAVSCRTFLSDEIKNVYVPTMEEYNDYRERMNKYLEELESRIAALENNDEKKNTQKEENTCKWSSCTIYFKIGYQENSIIVPVLTSDNKQEFICPPIDLGRANISEIKDEISKIVHRVSDTLGVPVFIAIRDKGIDTLDFIYNTYSTVNVTDNEYHAILKAATITL